MLSGPRRGRVQIVFRSPIAVAVIICRVDRVQELQKRLDVFGITVQRYVNQAESILLYTLVLLAVSPSDIKSKGSCLVPVG